MAAAIKRFENAAAAPPTAAQRGGGSAQERQPSKAQQEANARRPAQNSRENAKRFVEQNLPKLGEISRLPRDAREAEGHRRGRHRDAGPHARADRVDGDGSRQARLRAEAALLVGRGSAGPRARRRRIATKSSPRWATRATRCDDARTGYELHRARRDRRGPGGACLDQPAARLLAAGRAASGAARRRSEASARLERRARGQAAGRGSCRRLSRSRRISTGTCSSAGRRRSSITPSITRSTGAAGWTGARARSATWARISSIIRSGRSNLGYADDDRNAVHAVQRRVLPVRRRRPTTSSPQRGNLPPVKLTWYDGGLLPPKPAEHRRRADESGRRR